MRTFAIQSRGSEFSIKLLFHYGGSHEEVARRIRGILSSVEGS